MLFEGLIGHDDIRSGYWTCSATEHNILRIEGTSRKTARIWDVGITENALQPGIPVLRDISA
jgi:hypothetical protein